ncbi:MAG: hypothetical protein R3E08_07390 [Thiotrichaceae bacterium]
MTTTAEIVGFHLGQRDKSGAMDLWQSLPPVYRRRLLYRFLGAYSQVTH